MDRMCTVFFHGSSRFWSLNLRWIFRQLSKSRCVYVPSVVEMKRSVLHVLLSNKSCSIKAGTIKPKMTEGTSTGTPHQIYKLSRFPLDPPLTYFRGDFKSWFRSKRRLQGKLLQLGAKHTVMRKTFRRTSATRWIGRLARYSQILEQNRSWRRRTCIQLI